MAKGRIILHVDMNSFYASVEQIHDPSLRGKPLAVAGNPKERKGIIITCSYEARAYGVYTTQRVSEALQKCPQLIVVAPNFEKYREASRAFYYLLKQYTELVEPVSIDESYVDLTGACNNRNPMDVVYEIQTRIYEELQLPCSIGVAPNKFLAKMASNMKKPMGVTVIRKRDVPIVLWPLPVIEMHGVGEKTAQKLERMGIQTIGQLAQADERTMQNTFGINGVKLIQKANGVDDRAVDPTSMYDTKSVGNSTTLRHDLTTIEEIEDVLYTLAEKVSMRLKAKRLVGTTISIQIKYSDWKNQTNSKSIQNATDDVRVIFDVAKALVSEHWKERPVRLLGVTVGHVIDKHASSEQLSIFNYEAHAKEEPIIEVVHALERKFGEGIIQKGIKGVKVSKYQANTSFSKDFLDDLK